MTNAEGGFWASIEVRVYELDTQGHLNQAVYHQYAEHARWQLLAAAGLTADLLLGRRIALVMLESNIRFRRELRAAECVRISCQLEPTSSARTIRVPQAITLKDGTLVAELDSLCGLFDLDTRRLLDDPLDRLTALADHPAALMGHPERL
jgi:acyl-CoA thioester hydrolase